MDFDRIWITASRFVNSIDNRRRILCPSESQLPEPTQEDFHAACKIIDTFENFTDNLGSFCWERDLRIPSEATRGLLYTSLRALEHEDCNVRDTKFVLDIIAKRHDDIILREGGPYPNDLPYSLLHQVLRCISSLMHSMDQCRSRLREEIHRLSRHGIRHLTILDLPNELLIQIFEQVNTYDSAILWSKSRRIKDVRLTCRRFCELSSHLLLTHVNVDLRPESLSRLGEISRHPTIRSGVRLVRLRLVSYYSELSTDLRRFAKVWSRSLAKDIGILRAAIAIKDVARHFQGLLPSDVHPTLAKCNSALAAWERFADSRELLPGSEVFMEVLRTAHREYQRLFDIQTRLLEDGGFVQAFASAISQMPHIKYLVIEEDYSYYHAPNPQRQPMYKAIHDPNALCWTYLEPMNTSDANKYGLDLSWSMNLILNILAAIPGAWPSLRYVEISIGRVGDAALLTSSPNTRQRISILSKQLRGVSISFKALQRGFIANTESDFYQLLLEISDTDSLKDIHINLGAINIEESNAFDIGPVLNRHKRPGLTKLGLRGVAIHANELELFTSSLRPIGYLNGCYFRGVNFDLLALQLLSGTWAEVLDLLRAKSDDRPSLVVPSGAECDNMSINEYHRVFVRPSWGNPSLAEVYVQRRLLDDPNPLLTN